MDVAVTANNNAHKRCRVKLVGPKTRELELKVSSEKLTRLVYFFGLAGFFLAGFFLLPPAEPPPGLPPPVPKSTVNGNSLSS